MRYLYFKKRILSTTTVLLSFFSALSYGAEIEKSLNFFISEYEIPRLSNIYPNAEIIIELENRASFAYLPDCPQNNLNIENPREAAQKRTNYTVECIDPTWKIYVPISQQILIEAYKASTPISRKQPITQQNADLTKVDVTQLRGQIFNKENPPYGLIASRNININTFITDQNTEQPILIKKGKQVMIRAQSGSISVHMNGESLEDGILGQQIKVKNASSGRIVYGKVVSSNEILVNY